MSILKVIENCPNFNDLEKFQIITNLLEIRDSLELSTKCKFDIDAKSLNSCMRWAYTPQGYEYWESIHYKHEFGVKVNQNKKKLKFNLELKKKQELEEME